MASVRAHIFIEGRVQGVSFRWWTQGNAKQLGLTGWVRNLADGRVEVVAEGEKEDIEKLIGLIKEREGPWLARVVNLDISWEEATGELNSFEIRR